MMKTGIKTTAVRRGDGSVLYTEIGKGEGFGRTVTYLELFPGYVKAEGKYSYCGDHGTFNTMLPVDELPEEVKPFFQ